MAILLNRKEPISQKYIHKWGAQDAKGVGGSGVHLPPRMHQERLKMPQFSEAPGEYWGTSWLLRRIIWIHTELGRTKERRGKVEGKKQEKLGRGPACISGRGTWSAGERSPRPWPFTGMMEAFEQLGSELTTLWQSEQSENHIDKPCCSLSYLGQACKSTGVHGSWELSHGDCGMIPGRELLLTVRSQPDGMGWGNQLHGMLLKESQEAIKESSTACGVELSLSPCWYL